MLGHDWAAWAAAKAVAAALVDAPRAPVAQHIQRLRTGQSYIDGFKGPRLSFRAWDGQLRQPLFLAHGDGVVGLAPLDGCTLVTAPYGPPGRVLGVLGVIGPTRMAYERIIPTVQATADLLGAALNPGPASP